MITAFQKYYSETNKGHEKCYVTHNLREVNSFFVVLIKWCTI